MALFLVVLLGFESFAAVVSDNDGAAFITKAEFDSLKNTFQKELNENNSNIDNKINDAINAYLNGVKNSQTEIRARLVDANNWYMWTSSDYPQYTEGKPYVHGACASGSCPAVQTPTANSNVFWVVLELGGKTDYKTNGNFKKHFVSKKNSYKDYFLNDIKGGCYDGYWKDEGEDIVVGGWTLNTTEYGAIENEYGLYPYDDNLFENVALSLQGTNVWDNLEITKYVSGTGWTGCSLSIQTASRLKGTREYDNNVSIYDEINDNRFYDVEGNNLIGVVDSTPAIAKNAKYSDFKSWWDDVIGTWKVSYGCQKIGSYNSSADEYRSTSYNVACQYNGGSFLVGKYNSQSATNANERGSYFKMANIADNIQFKNLWSSYTDAVSKDLNEEIYSSSSNYTTNYKDNIKYALIRDNTSGEVVPHLSLKAGYPLISVKKGEIIEWNVTAGSDALNIVAKYGPFQMGNVDPMTDADVEFTLSGGTTSHLFAAPANRKSTIRFTAEHDGIVFFKWTTNTNKSAGLNVSENPKVTLNNGGA